MGMHWIFGDQAGEVSIGTKASGNAALDRAIEMKRLYACGSVTSDRRHQQNCAMTVPILRIDGDEGRLG
jgi:hypothetical protein